MALIAMATGSGVSRRRSRLLLASACRVVRTCDLWHRNWLSMRLSHCFIELGHIAAGTELYQTSPPGTLMACQSNII